MKTRLIIITLLTLVSCSVNSDENVQIRISNISNYHFESVLMRAGGSEYTFEDISSGSVSEYTTFEYSYRYAYLEIKIDTTTLILQPIDFVGESRLNAGKYRYELDIVGDISGSQYCCINGQMKAD